MPVTYRRHTTGSALETPGEPGRSSGLAFLLSRESIPAWVRYMLPVLIMVTVTLFNLSISPGFPIYRFPVLYILAVIASAYLFGLGPAILSIILGLIAYVESFIIVGGPQGWERLASLGRAGIASYIIGSVAGAASAIIIRRSARRIRDLAAELAVSSNRTVNILESITDAFTAFDAEDRFIYVNAEAGRLLHRAPSYLIGKNIWDEFPEGRGTIFEEQYKKVKAEHKSTEYEAFYPPPLNTWYEVRAYPSPEGISVYFHDISRRKQAEEELARAKDAAEEARATLQAIIDTVPIGLIVTNTEGHFLQVNKAAEEMMGGPLIGGAGGPAPGSRYWLQRLSGEILPPEKSPLNISLTRGITVTNSEFMVKHRDGGETTVLVNSAPVRDSAGKIIAAVATINDVTEISNLRKALEHQVDILQRALIPPRPSIDKDYRIADTYIPGAAGLEVGGDFYDVFKTEGGKIGIMIGDVSGKGVEAAAIAAATRGTAHAFAYDLLSAGAALTHTNSVLTAEQPEDFRFFITMFLGMLDLESGVLNYSNAGHPPPAVWHPDKPVEFLTLGHPPIGVIETEQYDEQSFNLLPGDKLILYTDGISEARHDSSLFELKGIQHILEEYGALPPEDLLAKLLDAATEWANGRLTDDAAVIVLERQSQAADHPPAP